MTVPVFLPWNPPPSLENELHARLIDGRLIHQHVLFIEPVQQRLADLRPEDDVPRPIDVALSALRARGIGTDIDVKDLPPLIVAEVRGASLGLPSARDLVTISRAQQIIATVGLAFLIELALGLVIVGRLDLEQPAPRTCLVDRLPGLDDCVRLLLAVSAKDLARQWINVELTFADPSAAKLKDELDRMIELFAACVLAELARRLVVCGDSEASDELQQRLSELELHRRHFERWLTEPTEVPLSRELLCCWYPCWRRSRFIFGASRFDQLRELPLPSV
jgi:hypothetical protein